ncbi:MAG TPA: hypothetical protein ENI42_03415, partial [Thermoplasmatales archaeon]|nr:hypothetical protein [Thermoplasmatales archaeon]
MAVSLFSATYMLVSTLFSPHPTPSANIIFRVEENSITLNHCGGKALRTDTKLLITIDDTCLNMTIAEGLDSESKKDGVWNMGERVTIPTGDISGKQITINVVDTGSNSILMTGKLPGEKVSTPQPTTTLYTITPYIQTYSPIAIVADADDRLDNITLWYRYSPDNSSWSENSTFDTDTSPPWSWSFTFPNGAGYYQFYTIGMYNGEAEEKPSKADAACCYNNPPEISNPIPADSSTDIPTNPILTVTVYDADDDTLTVTWYSNSSGSWVVFAVDDFVDTSNGPVTLQQTNSNFSNYSRTYNWYVSVTDGVITNNSPYYRFTTQAINTWVDTIEPYEVTSSPLIITATGPGDLGNVTLWYRHLNRSWITLTYDDFESGWGNYTDGGRDCYLYTGGSYAYQGNNAAAVQDNSGYRSSFYHTEGIDVDTPGYTSIKIDFWFRAEGMEPGEDFKVKYYDGYNWYTVADYDCGDEFVNGIFYHEIIWINETDHNFPTDMKI